MGLYLLISVIVLLIIFIYFIKISVKVTFKYDENDAVIQFRVRALLGLIKLLFLYPNPKKKDRSNVTETTELEKERQAKEEERDDDFEPLRPWVTIHALLQHLSRIQDIVSNFLKKVQIRKFEWSSHFGTGEAASTGVLSGTVWALKGNAIGLISNFFSLMEQPKISVTPHFQEKVIKTECQCMFRFRLGHAIFAGIRLFLTWRKVKKQADEMVSPIQKVSGEKKDCS